jgi:hypothetical protein
MTHKFDPNAKQLTGLMVREMLDPWIQHTNGCINGNECTCGLNHAMQVVNRMLEGEADA